MKKTQVAFTLVFALVLVFMGIYRTLEGRKQYEPNKLEIFVSGACQRLAFESGDEPLTFRVVNSLGYATEGKLLKSKAYYPTVLEIPSPGSLSLGYHLEVGLPNGAKEFLPPQKPKSNRTICLEYLLKDSAYNTDLVEVRCQD